MSRIAFAGDKDDTKVSAAGSRAQEQTEAQRQQLVQEATSAVHETRKALNALDEDQPDRAVRLDEHSANSKSWRETRNSRLRQPT
ncbi:MAG: hypothetical protein U5O39_05080 [Gammaproteobacteria bacterium]|nr:hypothetical protein [Gammaproteobacteria bacterium]